MANRTTPARGLLARASRLALKTMGCCALGTAAYALSVSAIGVPHKDALPTVEPRVISASLSFDGTQPVLTGSVSDLFDNPIFSGPNRSEKTARATQEIDIAAFAQSFEQSRLRVAAQREEAVREITAVSERIEVASVNPSAIDSDGLRAIGGALGDTAALDPNTPRPATVPETLAYARATEPATDFTAKHSYSDREQWCMATGIYFEARGESYRGQVAVAQVIMNRVAHENYPNTICGVVYQNQHRRNACQFSFACDGTTNVNRTPEIAAWQRAQEITQSVLNEEIYLTEVADSTHYHATYVRPAWARNMDKLTQVGLHIFYRFKPGWQFG
jgi:spore germination cell wall hydrolase CwlJ-like protein